MIIHPRIDGRLLAELGVGDAGKVEWSHGERGCREAAFSLPLSRGRRHPLLSGRPLVELMAGPSSLWTGRLAEPDWTEMRFTALGLAADAGNFQALDSSSNSTAEPDTAVDEAIDRGWGVTRGAGIDAAAISDLTEGINSVAAILDTSADEQGEWWQVTADRVLSMSGQPAAPTYQIVPGVVDLGYADDDYSPTIAVRYRTTTGGFATELVTDAAAETRFGPREVPWDVTDLGPMTQARAQGLGAGVLAKGRSRLGWVSQIEVSANELLTMGGVPASLPLVRSLEVVRIHVDYDDMLDLDGRTFVDAMIGQTDYEAGSPTIRLSPVGKVAQTLSEVMEATVRAAAA